MASVHAPGKGTKNKKNDEGINSVHHSKRSDSKKENTKKSSSKKDDRKKSEKKNSVQEAFNG